MALEAGHLTGLQIFARFSFPIPLAPFPHPLYTSLVAAQQAGFRPKSSSLFTVFIILSTLLLFAFYNVSNPQHVGHDHLLNGADYVAYAGLSSFTGTFIDAFRPNAAALRPL